MLNITSELLTISLLFGDPPQKRASHISAREILKAKSGLYLERIHSQAANPEAKIFHSLEVLRGALGDLNDLVTTTSASVPDASRRHDRSDVW